MICLNRVHLVGAGAIGQAMVYALSLLPVTGALIVIEPECLSVSNLQRYVLAFDDDVGISKSTLVSRALKQPTLEVICYDPLWGTDPQFMHDLQTVCVGVDTAAARIGIQAGLPRHIYNAWTQPADIGWSRHERFGDDPCLACLYVPSGLRP